MQNTMQNEDEVPMGEEDILEAATRGLENLQHEIRAKLLTDEVLNSRFNPSVTGGTGLILGLCFTSVAKGIRELCGVNDATFRALSALDEALAHIQVAALLDNGVSCLLRDEYKDDDGLEQGELFQKFENSDIPKTV